MDLRAYLERIGCTGQPPLAQVHRAHVAAIPFENLDPRRGVPVCLDIDALQDKLVTARRGGYCFEHNLLLAAALRALGAEVEPMLGRVGSRNNPQRALSHLLLRVTMDGQVWHADVGFGSGTLHEPIPFGPGGPYQQDGWQWRVVPHGPELVLEGTQPDGRWADFYSFRPEPAPMIDIEVCNWYRATNPRSLFVTGLVVCVNRTDGTRTVLSDWGGTLRLKVERPDGETVTEVVPADAGTLLADRFGLPGWMLDHDGRPVDAGRGAGASGRGPAAQTSLR